MLATDGQDVNGLQPGFNSKKLAKRFQVLSLYLRKIANNLLWSAVPSRRHLISSSSLIGAVCARGREIKHNFNTKKVSANSQWHSPRTMYVF